MLRGSMTAGQWRPKQRPHPEPHPGNCREMDSRLIWRFEVPADFTPERSPADQRVAVSSPATCLHDVVSRASGSGVPDLLTRSTRNTCIARVRSVVYEPGERARILHAHEAVAEAIISGDASSIVQVIRYHRHEAVVEAIISGDGDRAENLTRDQVQQFLDRFKEIIQD